MINSSDDPLRVLVVDDDFMVARLHADMVDAVPGFRVVARTHSGAEGVRVALAEQPDVILLDQYLPDMSGLDVFERLRSAGLESDVIMVTASRSSEVIRRSLQLGATHYLVKPFTAHDLGARLRSLAEARTALAEQDELDQVAIDRIYAASRGVPAGPVLPKGLSQPTLELVVDCLRRAAEPLSAETIGARVGVARVSARRYLEYLVASGAAELSLAYGAAGRPRRLYRWRIG